MGFKGTKAEKKVVYDKKICDLLEQYSQVLVCIADNVESKQLQNIRSGLRPDSIVLEAVHCCEREINFWVERVINFGF
jgi:large subunit ribosomal protein LP0